MKTKTISELIEMCVTNRCAIRLEACTTGVVARVSGERGDVSVETSVYLDANDPDAGQKLDNAVKRIKQIA